MILRCLYDGKECSEHDFEPFHPPKYFNCYIFKGGRSKKTKTQTMGYGLSLTIYLEPQGDFLFEPYDPNTPVANADGFIVSLFVLRVILIINPRVSMPLLPLFCKIQFAGLGGIPGSFHPYHFLYIVQFFRISYPLPRVIAPLDNKCRPQETCQETNLSEIFAKCSGLSDVPLLIEILDQPLISKYNTL